MRRINNPLEIFKLLNRSNCRDCHEKTCMAFAVSVFKNKRKLHECPHLPPDVLQAYGGDTERAETIDENMAAAVERRKQKISEIDLADAASRLNAEFSDGKLTLKVFGRDFSVDQRGELTSEIHMNAWVAVPLLDHILEGQGRKPTGKWVNFRELKDGMSRFAHFQQRCEKPLKQVADTYPELFKDMLEIFDGKRLTGAIDADVAIVLHPLPLVPMLIGYWYPEDEMESSLLIYFDEAAGDNLNIDSLYTLGEGMVMMFGKIALRHGER